MPDLSDQTRFPPSAGPVDEAELHAAWQALGPEDRRAVSRIFANTGKAIAAYERLLRPGRSRFDWYVETLVQGDPRRAATIFTVDEVAGLRLFIGRAQCVRYHNGPLFSNHTFHNTGTPDFSGKWLDDGRESGVHEAKRDPFNCLGPYSDAAEEECTELRFVKETDPHFKRAFKTPTLRNLSKTAPYMHAGQFRTLAQILEHYNTAPRPPVGISELVRLGLNAMHLRQLEAFLRTLDSAVIVPAELVLPPDSSNRPPSF